MNIVKPSVSGTLESSDIYICIKPNDENGIDIKLDSIVFKQFGRRIETVIRETLSELDVKNAIVIAKDMGALDCTIRARIETAVRRGSELHES